MPDRKIDDAEFCTDGGEHMPDWTTVQPADGAPGIVDVNCARCGRSGSLALNPEDVNW